MPSDLDQKQIEIILKRGFCSREQVTECLMERPVDSEGDFARALVERGMITAHQAEHVRNAAAGGASTAPEIPGYDIIEEVGSGAMGAVFKAKQTSMDRTVAVKVLPSKLTKDTAFVERFLREARTGGRLNHPNIVQGIDTGRTEDGSYYFIMEFVEGESLKTILERDGRLPEERVLPIIRDVAMALDHASGHGLIHRDVKPENIVVSKSGTAKLADLGLAATVDQVGNETAQVAGTPHYIAPEVVRGDRNIDVRADIYSLGATFFHLVTGSVPFDGPSASVVMTKHLSEQFPSAHETDRRVSPPVSRVIQKMTARNKTERYASPKALVADLDRIIRGEVKPAAVRSSKPSRSRQRRRKKGTPAGAIVAIVIGIVAVAAVGVFVVAHLPGKPEVTKPNKPPKPGPDKPDPADKKLEAARKALANARDYQSDHPDDLDGIEQAYTLVLKYPGTAPCDTAKAQLKIVEKRRRSREAKAALAAAGKKTPALREAEKFGEACNLYQAILDSYPDTPAATRAKAAFEKLSAEVDRKYENLKAGAEKLVKSEKFQKAIDTYSRAFAWGMEDCSTAARTRINEIEEIVRERETAEAARIRKQIARARGAFDAAVSKRKYAEALDAAESVLGIIPAEKKRTWAARAEDMRKLEALHRKMIRELQLHLGEISCSAGGAIGKIVKADDAGVAVKAGKIRATAEWSEISARQYGKVAKHLFDDDTSGLLAIALFYAWEGENHAAEKALEAAEDAGADTKRAERRLVELRIVTDERKGKAWLAKLRKLVQNKDYKQAHESVHNLERAMGETAFYEKYKDDIQRIDSICAEHRINCPTCGGKGWVTCPKCHGKGKLRMLRKCRKCAGIGKIRRGMTLITCPTCRGRGKVIGMGTCPKCGGNGRCGCPTCKGAKQIYR